MNHILVSHIFKQFGHYWPDEVWSVPASSDDVKHIAVFDETAVILIRNPVSWFLKRDAIITVRAVTINLDG